MRSQKCFERDGETFYPIIIDSADDNKAKDLKDIIDSDLGITSTVSYDGIYLDGYGNRRNTNHKQKEIYIRNYANDGTEFDIIINLEKMIMKHDGKIISDLPVSVREVPFKTDKFVLGKIRVLEINLSWINQQFSTLKGKADAKKKNQQIKEEETKLKTLFVGGEMSLLGIPAENIEIINTSITIKFPALDGNTYSTLIRLDIIKGRKKVAAFDDTITAHVFIGNQSTNSRPKFIKFQTLNLAQIKPFIESFKQVFFKDIENGKEESTTETSLDSSGS